jgi:hypothetical protein
VFPVPSFLSLLPPPSCQSRLKTNVIFLSPSLSKACTTNRAVVGHSHPREMDWLLSSNPTQSIHQGGDGTGRKLRRLETLGEQRRGLLDLKIFRLLNIISSPCSRVVSSGTFPAALKLKRDYIWPSAWACCPAEILRPSCLECWGTRFSESSDCSLMTSPTALPRLKFRSVLRISKRGRRPADEVEVAGLHS